MKSKLFLIFLVHIFINLSCSNNKNSDENYSAEIEYYNGSYCAEIEYYNPRTRTHSTYTLPVEIENNKLTVIHFPNGGWLDDTHFTPPTIENGKAKFVSDRKYRYTVKILNKGKCRR